MRPNTTIVILLLIIVALLAWPLIAPRFAEDPIELIRRLEAGGASATMTTERFIPEIEANILVNDAPLVARRYASNSVAVRAANDRITTAVDGQWVFVAEHVHPFQPHVGLHGVRSALRIPDQTYDSNSLARIAAILREIFRAEVQFQGGAYLEQDYDQVGEYAFLSEMCGGRIRGGRVQEGLIRLLPYEEFLEPTPVMAGYCWAIHLPDGRGGWVATIADDPVPDAGFQSQDMAVAAGFPATPMNDRERWWICFAWPARETSGIMFAIDQSGDLRRAAYSGRPPLPSAYYVGGLLGGTVNSDWREEPGN